MLYTVYFSAFEIHFYTERSVSQMRKFCLLIIGIFFIAAGSPKMDGEVLVFDTDHIRADVPIIMYHLVTTDRRYVGKYGITPEQLQEDLDYLKDNGYTTIVMQDLIDFVNSGKFLPEKPIMLTFDDGNASDYKYVFSVLKEYDMRAVLAIIGKVTDKYTLLGKSTNYTIRFPNMTWDEVREMHDSGYIEIQNHSYDLHGSIGSGIKNGEDPETYRSRLATDLQLLQDRCREELGSVPTAFVYPLGLISSGSKEVLKEMGFAGSFSCEEGYAVVKYQKPDTLFNLKRINRTSRRSVEKILQDLEL